MTNRRPDDPPDNPAEWEKWAEDAPARAGGIPFSRVMREGGNPAPGSWGAMEDAMDEHFPPGDVDVQPFTKGSEAAVSYAAGLEKADAVSVPVVEDDTVQERAAAALERVRDAIERVPKIGSSPDAIYETELLSVLRDAADALSEKVSSTDAWTEGFQAAIRDIIEPAIKLIEDHPGSPTEGLLRDVLVILTGDDPAQKRCTANCTPNDGLHKVTCDRWPEPVEDES